MNTHEDQKTKGKKPIGCYIADDLHKRLKLSCVTKGETISQRLVKLIEDYLNE